MDDAHTSGSGFCVIQLVFLFFALFWAKKPGLDRFAAVLGHLFDEIMRVSEVSAVQDGLDRVE
jgi:hypothetical protein